MPLSDSAAAASPGERTVVSLLLRQAQTLGKQTFLQAGSTTWSFEGMAETAARRAGTLGDAGVMPGDRVAAILRNGPELAELFFACAWAGALLVPLNVASKGEQLAHMLRNAAPRILVVDGEFVPHLDVPGGLPAELEQVWLVGASTVGHVGQHELAPVPQPSAPVDAHPAAPGDPVAVLYTSGTTGPSKGVVCPNGQFWWWGVNTAAALGIGGDDVLYNCLPLFHTNALNTILQGLTHGAQVVIGDRFSASRFWQTLAETEATVTYLLGAMATILAEREPSPLDRGHNVRVALSPATAPALYPVFSERFGIRLVERARDDRDEPRDRRARR